jgi:hypothetical protein
VYFLIWAVLWTFGTYAAGRASLIGLRLQHQQGLAGLALSMGLLAQGACLALLLLANTAVGLGPAGFRSLACGGLATLVGLAVWLIWRERRTKTRTVEPAGVPHWERLLLWAGIGLCLLLVSSIAIDASTRAILNGDEGHIWNYKAKLLALYGGVGPAFGEHMQSSTFPSHKDYPLLSPVLQVGPMLALGDSHTPLARLPIQLGALALVLSTASALGMLVRPWLVGVICVLLVTSRKFMESTAVAGADNLVALGLVQALLGYLLYQQTNRRAYGYLIGLGLALSILAKNEGMLHVVAVGAAFLASSVLWQRQLLRGWRKLNWLPMVVPPTMAALATWTFNWIYGFRNDFLETGPEYMASTGAATEGLVAKSSTILGFVWSDLLRDLNSYNGLLGLCLALIVLRLRHWIRNADAFWGLGLLAATGGVLAVYLVTPHALAWHLPSSCERVVWQLIPGLTIWAAGVLAQTFPLLGVRKAPEIHGQ